MSGLFGVGELLLWIIIKLAINLMGKSSCAVNQGLRHSFHSNFCY